MSACPHAVPAGLHCPACRRERHDATYAIRHQGHHVIETAAVRGDGRHYRQCLTCAPWRAPNANSRTRTYRPTPPDDVAIWRAAAGEPPERLRPVERRAAILRLVPELPVPIIAERIRCSERTVWRHLAAARRTAA